MPSSDLDRETVADEVWRVLASESRLAAVPQQVTGDEPLNGELLRISSLGLLGVLLKLEDALNVVLADDVFVGRAFRVVDDVIDAVLRGTR